MKPTLLVLAAGMGSRYGGVKQIDSVGLHGECLLDYSAFDAARSGFSKVVFVIRKDIEKDFRERLFDRIARNFDAEYVFQGLDSLLTADELAKAAQRTKPWGTIHAVLCAEEKIRTPFAVINSDDATQTLLRVIASLYDNKYLEATYKMLQKFFQIASPNNIEGYAYMALCCHDLKYHEEFLKYLKKACEVNPKECRMVLGHLFPKDMEPEKYYDYLKTKLL
jgi:tetratricopeptide (TPR) repeat protein